MLEIGTIRQPRNQMAAYIIGIIGKSFSFIYLSLSKVSNNKYSSMIFSIIIF